MILAQPLAESHFSEKFQWEGIELSMILAENQYRVRVKEGHDVITLFRP